MGTTTWTTGTLLLWGGVAGVGASALLGVVLFIVLRRAKRRIEAQIRSQYQSDAP